jgi:membrane protein YdbS with pleckstrin-like domain
MYNRLIQPQICFRRYCISGFGFKMLLASLYVSVFCLFIGVLWFFVERRHYHMKKFELNDEGIKSRSDFLVIRETSIKYVDIKQVELMQGPIQRFYGIGSVSVITHATTSNAGIELYDIKEYQEVYEFLLNKIQQK